MVYCIVPYRIVCISSTNAVRELAKAAACVNEIYGVLNESDMNGLDCVTEELPFIQGVSQRVRSEAEKVLARGLEQLNQSELAASLQIFYNLGPNELVSAVQSTLAAIRKKLGVAIRQTFDVALISERVTAAMSSVKTGGGGGSGSGRADGKPPSIIAALTAGGAPGGSVSVGSTWRATLWDRVEVHFVDSFYSLIRQVWTLQRVLAKKKDPTTHQIFLHVYNANCKPAASASASASASSNSAAAIKSKTAEPAASSAPAVNPTQSVLHTFWEEACAILTNELEDVNKPSIGGGGGGSASVGGRGFVKTQFINEFPRLSLTFHSLLTRIITTCASGLHADSLNSDLPDANDIGSSAKASPAFAASRDSKSAALAAAVAASSGPGSNGVGVSSSSGADGTHILGARSRQIFMRSLVPFQHGFLSKSLSKLNEPVNVMFGSNQHSIPSVGVSSTHRHRRRIRCVTQTNSLIGVVLHTVIGRFRVCVSCS